MPSAADEGYFYVRAEYPKAVQRLKHSIREALARGYLGKSIFGSDFNFSVKIKEGAGAFCVRRRDSPHRFH